MGKCYIYGNWNTTFRENISIFIPSNSKACPHIKNKPINLRIYIIIRFFSKIYVSNFMSNLDSSKFGFVFKDAESQLLTF